MATKLGSIADSRPRIRRDVLFTKTAEGVLFHNAERGFHLQSASAYQFASLLVPFLDGEYTVADICADLGDSQQAMVMELVAALFERGFARDVPLPRPGEAGEVLPPEVAARFDAQLNYIDHYADGARGRFGAFRQARIAVLGGGFAARSCALSLLRNGAAGLGVTPGPSDPAAADDRVRAEAAELTRQGCPTTLTTLDARQELYTWDELDGYEVVVCAGPGSARQVSALLREGVPAGRTLLPAWQHGARAIVGPLMRSHSQPCWVCAVLRLGANTDPGDSADLWSSLSPAAPQPGLADRRMSRPLAAMVGNLLGYEVFRLITGFLPAETEGKIIIQDAETMDVFTEPVQPHPRCPYCQDPGDAAVAAGLGRGVDLALPSVATADQAEDGEDLLVELTERSAILVATNAGVFTRFDDDTLTQTPLKISRVSLGTGHTGRRTVAAFDLRHVVGSRLAALRVACEVYSEHTVAGTNAAVGGSLPTATDPAQTAGALRAAGIPFVPPSALSSASGLVSESADVPRWVVATSLITHGSAAVPAAAVRTFGPDNTTMICSLTAAGTAAGDSLPEACTRGLLSALSYDALQRAIRGIAAVSWVPMASFETDPELTFLLRSARNLDAPLELIDLGETARSSVPVLLARTVDPGSGLPLFALGSDFSGRQAAVTAIRDLLGQVQLARDLPGVAIDTGDPLITAFEPSSLAVTGTADDVLGVGTSADVVLARLRLGGLDAYAVPTTSADLRAAGVITVRVILTRAG